MLIRHRAAAPTAIRLRTLRRPPSSWRGSSPDTPERCPGRCLTPRGSSEHVGECVIVAEHAVLRARELVIRTTRCGLVTTPFSVPTRRCWAARSTPRPTWRPAPRSCTARWGSDAVVADDSLVHARTVQPREFFLAPNTIAVGDPVAVYAAGDPQLPQATKGRRVRQPRLRCGAWIGRPDDHLPPGHPDSLRRVRRPPRRRDPRRLAGARDYPLAGVVGSVVYDAPDPPQSQVRSVTHGSTTAQATPQSMSFATLKW